jgi:hypothetical protein
MSRLKPATAASKTQIDEALKLMRRARTLLRDAGATKATTKILSAINSAEGARRHCERRPVMPKDEPPTGQQLRALAMSGYLDDDT